MSSLRKALLPSVAVLLCTLPGLAEAVLPELGRLRRHLDAARDPGGDAAHDPVRRGDPAAATETG